MSIVRTYIGIFGRTNTGKSSLLNVLIGQDIAIVSEEKGTTTDPVKKIIELNGIGASVLIDTAGIDDNTSLGQKRIEKTKHIIESIDIALVVITDNIYGTYEDELISIFDYYKIPYLIIYNKIDLSKPKDEIIKKYASKLICVSSKTHEGMDNLFDRLKLLKPKSESSLLYDIVNKGDIVLLVTPIDISAPVGRLILPQVNVLRELLDNNSIAIVIKETEIEAFKKKNIDVNLIITDSQVFDMVAKAFDDSIALTSFSILFARQKGDIFRYKKGAYKIDSLQDNDSVLILESCTHKHTCEDIGRVKIPNIIKKRTNKNIVFDFISADTAIPKDIEKYSLIIQCGGCMKTRTEINHRLQVILNSNINITNYGMVFAYINGILDRAMSIFDN